MPFNFVTRENYDFDFNVIFNVLMQNQIFKKYEHYANRWIQVFQSLNTVDAIMDKSFISFPRFLSFSKLSHNLDFLELVRSQCFV